MLKRVWTVSNGKIWKKCNYVHSPEALLSKVAPAAENLFFARRSQGHLWCHFPWFRWCILLTWFFTYCPEVEKGVAVDNSCGMSSPSSVQDSGQETPQLKQTGMLLNQGIVQGSLTEKAQFSLGCTGSFLHHWSWHNLIILFVSLSPGFHPSVAVLTSASSILAFKWSKGLASNSLHTKFATTWCIFQMNFNLAILRLSTLSPKIKMNCQTAISYRGLRNDNKFEEGMIWARKQPWWVTIDCVLLQVSGEKALEIINHTAITLRMREMLDWSRHSGNSSLQNGFFLIHM